MISPLLTDLEALTASLRRGEAVNVDDQSSKDRTVTLASRYFSDVRPIIIAVVGEEAVLSHDEQWQQLIVLRTETTHVRRI